MRDTHCVHPPGYAGLAVNLDLDPKLVVVVGDHKHFDLFKTNEHKKY
jgi:hypothetical protein